MAYPPRLFVDGYWYHVITRGQRREPLFFAPVDRIAYCSFLDRELERRGGSVGSYCLMTNHVHLLIRMEETPLDTIVQTVHMKYAKWFNRRRETVGHVFQGRPRMKIVLDDRYLKQLVGYIHRNPVEANMVESVQEFDYSSWRWFRHEGMNELATGMRPPGFQGDDCNRRFNEVVQKNEEPDGGENYWGTQDEWAQMERREEGRDGRTYKERRGRTPKEEIARDIVEGTDWTIEDLKSPSRKRAISALRQDAMCRMYEEGHNPTDIGKWFNRTPSAVIRARESE